MLQGNVAGPVPGCIGDLGGIFREYIISLVLGLHGVLLGSGQVSEETYNHFKPHNNRSYSNF